MTDELPVFQLDEGGDEFSVASIVDVMVALPGWNAEFWYDDDADAHVFRCMDCGDRTAVPAETFRAFLNGGLTIRHQCRTLLK